MKSILNYYPIGSYQKVEHFSAEVRSNFIKDISQFPSRLLEVVKSLTDEQKLWTYREGGWNIAQVIHHCADSHINAYIRCKLGVTEDSPTINAYDENKWAAFPDATNLDISTSLNIIKGLHHRWTTFFEAASESEFKKTVFHPQHQQKFSLEELLSQYAWHSNHHLAHVRLAVERHK